MVLTWPVSAASSSPVEREDNGQQGDSPQQRDCQVNSLRTKASPWSASSFPARTSTGTTSEVNTAPRTISVIRLGSWFAVVNAEAIAAPNDEPMSTIADRSPWCVTVASLPPWSRSRARRRRHWFGRLRWFQRWLILYRRRYWLRFFQLRHGERWRRQRCVSDASRPRNLPASSAPPSGRFLQNLRRCLAQEYSPPGSSSCGSVFLRDRRGSSIWRRNRLVLLLRRTQRFRFVVHVSSSNNPHHHGKDKDQGTHMAAP